MNPYNEHEFVIKLTHFSVMKSIQEVIEKKKISFTLHVKCNNGSYT